jgi:hypothetical protein
MTIEEDRRDPRALEKVVEIRVRDIQRLDLMV